ncbi:thiol reductant ABC exporter subunit CydC [Actinoplanes friuliensis]|uniref:Multidrug resistance protein 2 n=1 Tax=Actinoplanes friuliensis DSM 7358 TaxID=1246995 RepID=U5VZI1_9ACTN|nr:thiol reductant ABC exporter subunit CydC [Actinoplanes friuliensis]AGZ42299.1 Multidrug resistance protein 2 [Actinoplanes friuliensis DSM 7358]
MSRGPVDPRLLRHARSSRTGIAVLSLLGAGQAAATVTVAVALARIVTGHDAIFLLAAAFVLRAVLTWAEQVVAQRTAAAVTDELRRSSLAAALGHGPAWVARYGSGRLTAVLSGGLDALRPWFSGYLPALVLGVALPPLVIVAMAVTDRTSAVIAVVTLPLIPVLGALIGWATQKQARAAWEADARLAGHFLDVVRGLPTLRIFGRADRQTAVVREMSDRHRSATVRVLRVAFLSSTALDLVATLSVGLIAVEAGLRVAAGAMPLAPALLVILLAPEVYRPLREMAAKYHAGADATAVIADVDEILAEALPATGDQAVLVPAEALTADGRFGLGGARPAVFASRLRVRHPGSAVDALALDGLSVQPGEIVALRGPSGAGKTTALRVLAGLQPATAGRIELSGPGLLYLPQRPALPHVRTVADVLPGLDDASINAELARLGLELEPGTVVGEHGSGVSAGQKQRLALAAVLRAAEREPRVLLLDEPTAHLDAAAEQVVVDRLRAAADRGCAVLVVAHRPGLLDAADRIVDVHPGPAPASAPTDDRFVAPMTATGEIASAGSPASTSSSAGPAVAGLPGPIATTARRPSRFSMAARWLARRPGTAVGLGALSWLAGTLLTGAAAWLLVRASSLPPVLTLSTAVVLVRGSAVARPLLRYLERLVSHDVAFARLGEWRSRVFADLVPRVPGPRLRRRGDLLTRVADDVDARVDGLLRGRLPALAAAVTLAVVTAVAVLVLPVVAVPLAAGLLISAVLAPALASRQAARLDAATARARAELRDAVVETVDGIEELGVIEELGGDDALGVPDRRSRELARLEARAARSAGTAAALGQLGWGIAVAGTALVTVGSGLSAEWATVLLLAVVTLGEPVAALPDAAVARRRSAGAVSRLEEISAQPPTATRYAGTTGGDVAIRDVSAGWDPDRPPVVRDVSLDLRAGSRVAVLGPSGGGKSTLAAVLAGLLDPRSGTVTGTGHTVLVGDETDHVFASTVRENLRLARPGATDTELLGALARVGLDDWARGLPAGLDTWVGAGGSTISGGQRRRLATARALLAGPDLLVLDEPTEGLDEAGAEALMADLLTAMAGHTVLLFTHRTEGLDRVDATYELRGGRLSPARRAEIAVAR